MPLRAVVSALRPRQWTKNLLVFAAYLFAARFDDSDATRQAILAFAAMCLVSSGTYVLNDLFDLERDRNHPTKKSRPFASGALSKSVGVVFSIVLLAGGLGVAALGLNRWSVAICSVYILLQLAYNVSAKHVPVTDVFCIAFGFLLRAMLGAAAIWVPISIWLLYCTGTLALMLGFAKRRGELLQQANGNGSTRETLVRYSRESLDALVIHSATAAALCYGIYSIESETARKYPTLAVTTLFVAYGIGRYLFLVFSRDEGSEPEAILLRDPHVLGSVLLFLFAAVAAVSGWQVPLFGE